MTAATTNARQVRANGIDIHYVEAGDGEPLLLLENGMISTNPIWAPWPSSYAAHRDTLAEHFRVISPDFRGSGRTAHTDGPLGYDLLVDDAVALIDELDLGRPHVCGYGDGGMVATILAIRHPDKVSAIVNHGGYDLLTEDPQAPALVMTRTMLGGSPDADHADPDAVESSPIEPMRRMVALMKADHDAAQGEGHWKTVLRRTFDRVSRPSGYTVADLAAVTARTLILAGDRDPFCTAEQGVAAYRALRRGALAILPETANGINASSVRLMIEFCERASA
jgi:pimeloyl-ACP methyl ester carboxylesterase